MSDASASQRTPRMVLMDGHSLAYRAFYALPPLSTRSGQPVNAVLGFTNMLLKAVEIESPDFVALSFDRGLPTARLEHFTEYKAQRDKMPEGMAAQLPVIEEVVRAFGIPIFTSEEHEADDCIGTLARSAEARGYEVAIISGDLDMLQLVSPQVRVMATIRGIGETVRYDEAAVQARYGFPPSRIPDYKALAGDASDNIPGVVGIGDGTARKLIQEFGSADGLLARLDEVPTRWRDKIAASVDDVHRFRQLATIHTDLELAIDWEACRWSGVPDSAAELLTRLEFHKIVERLGLGAPAASSAAPAVEGPPLAVTVVRDAAAWRAALDAVAAADAVGLAWVRDGGRTVALALATDERTAWVAPVAGRSEGQLFGSHGLDPEALAQGLAETLGRADRPAWAFDWKAALAEWPALDAIAATRPIGDVAVASYLLESGESQKSLAAIATRHNTRVAPEAETVLGKGVKAQHWADASEEILAGFAAENAASIRDLGIHLGARLAEERQEGLFAEVEMPLAWVLARMERLGVALDIDYLRRLSTEMEGDLERIQGQVLEAAGRPFNLNSPKQLGEVLFDHLQIPGGKKTKTGAYTTDAEVLSKLAVEHPICQLIMDYREVAKLKGTYVEAFPRLVRAESGRLHTSWNATVAATGRLSSSEPNLQNIPIRSELGRRIRRAFVAPPATVLLCADYSQIELRIMAHLSKDPNLVQVFREGGDVHRATASQIFGVAPDEVTADMRRKAKEVNFGIMYGMGPEGLANRIQVSRKDARAFIDRYLETFAGVKAFMDGVIRDAEAHGFVETMLGRRRYLPDVQSRNRMVKAAAERMAINAPIQGTAADLIKKAMVVMDALIRGGDLPARMIMQVHDELVFEVEPSRLDAVAPRVQHVMESALEMSVPLVVDLKSGLNWAEVRPYAAEVASPR